jgi:hypothetical protein
MMTRPSNPGGSPGKYHDPNQWAQKLADQARILGEARMLRDEQDLTDELTTAILTRFKDYLKRNEKTDAWAARSMGIAAATLSAVVAGNYAADPRSTSARSTSGWSSRSSASRPPSPAASSRPASPA